MLLEPIQNRASPRFRAPRGCVSQDLAIAVIDTYIPDNQQSQYVPFSLNLGWIGCAVWLADP